MPLPPLVGGRVPVGRHPATLDEVKADFVDAPAFASSSRRPYLWDQFELGLATLQGVVSVHAAWLAGSFITDKVDPGDVDVTFLVNAAQRYSLPPQDARVVDSFLLRMDPVTGTMYRPHGLDLDSFIVDWHPFYGDFRQIPEYGVYTGWRGYWDDFWLRERSVPKRTSSPREDAFPVRGYVEVSLDAYV